MQPGAAFELSLLNGLSVCLKQMLRKSSAAIDTCLRADLTFLYKRIISLIKKIKKKILKKIFFYKVVTRPQKSIKLTQREEAATFVLQTRAQLEL